METDQEESDFMDTAIRSTLEFFFKDMSEQQSGDVRLARACIQDRDSVLDLRSLKQLGLVVAGVCDPDSGALACENVANGKLLFLATLRSSFIDFSLCDMGAYVSSECSHHFILCPTLLRRSLCSM